MRRLTGLFLGLLLLASPLRAAASEVTTDEALLDTLQHLAFNYFWYEANPTNGLIRDRSARPTNPNPPASIAAVGFGLSSITVGIDRGWITRAQGVDRVKRTLYTFWTKPQSSASGNFIGYKGLFYHFLDMNTGYRTWDSELSTIDTALLFAGILDAKQYFGGADTSEARIRALADSITRRADWRFMRSSDVGIQMGWKPGNGFLGYGNWVGYNEAMILYHIAMGTPVIAHRDTSSDWALWTGSYSWQTHYGQSYVNFPPLFGHQYSHCWVDYRYEADLYMRNRGITYFENSRRATLAQRSYAIANPLAKVGYSDSLWGLTASDVPPPVGYNARGAPPAQADDGTITPTAPLSSIPFAPEECLAVAWYLWNHYRDTPLWGPYGFRDAFNLTVEPDWYSQDYLGIDQGPIVLMIENHRTGRIWSRMRFSPDLQRGLAAAGFQPVTATVPAPVASFDPALRADPNPFADLSTLRFRLATQAHVRLTLLDVQGREVAKLADEVRAAGAHAVPLRGRGLPSGVYLYRLESEGRSWTQRCVLIR